MGLIHLFVLLIRDIFHARIELTAVHLAVPGNYFECLVNKRLTVLRLLLGDADPIFYLSFSCPGG